MYFVGYCSEVSVLLHIFDTRPFVITKIQIRPLNVFSRDVLPRYRSFRFVWNVRRVHSCAANSVNFISRRSEEDDFALLAFLDRGTRLLQLRWSLLYHPFRPVSFPFIVAHCSVLFEEIRLEVFFAKIVAPSRAERTFGKRKSGRTEGK